jgi:hypothetical protein
MFRVLDDEIVIGSTFLEHLLNPRKVLQRFREARLKLRSYHLQVTRNSHTRILSKYTINYKLFFLFDVAITSELQRTYENATELVFTSCIVFEEDGILLP